MKHLILFNSTHTVATISFSKSTYKVAENEEAAVIEIVRSGNIETEVVVLIGSHTYQGSATGKFLIICSQLLYSLLHFNSWPRLCSHH